MATSSRTLSPGGSLLRASRMFSLPAALSAPPSHMGPTNKGSETATQVFPTLQTVTAPDNFRYRGDWGFKRNLPLRSTARTSTPYLRIKQVDSVEHITDYSSAADHTLTLEKFQEMNVVISLPRLANFLTARDQIRFDTQVGESIFDDKYDFTVLDKDKIAEAGHRRWKYQGPWLANMAEGDFQNYVKRQVRGRRAEFREFMRPRLAPKLTEQAKQRAMEEGTSQKIADMQAKDVTDEDITRFLQRSREKARMSLYDMVSEFLDLAPCRPNGTDYTQMDEGETKHFTADDIYSRTGPPITHPSAGLSYLRTNAYLENNPVYGPQEFHRPIKGRLMTLKSMNGMVGLGGFVAPSELAKTAYNAKGFAQHGHNEPGGPTIWVNVTSAHIDSTGRAIVHNVQAHSEAILIERERLGEKRLFHAVTEEALLAAQKLRESRGTGRRAVWQTGLTSSKATRRSGSYQDARTQGSSDYGLKDVSPEGRDF